MKHVFCTGGSWILTWHDQHGFRMVFIIIQCLKAEMVQERNLRWASFWFLGQCKDTWKCGPWSREVCNLLPECIFLCGYSCLSRVRRSVWLRMWLHSQLVLTELQSAAKRSSSSACTQLMFPTSPYLLGYSLSCAMTQISYLSLAESELSAWSVCWSDHCAVRILVVLVQNGGAREERDTKRYGLGKQ